MAPGAGAGQVVLVLGGGGFVGESLAAALLASSLRVILLDREDFGLAGLEDVRRLKGDATDRRCLEDTVRRHRPAVVVHLASVGMSGAAMLDPSCWTTNVVGVETLLAVCSELGVRRVVYASSYNVVFGGQEVRGGDEQLPVFALHRHTDRYSPSKATAERKVLEANGVSTAEGLPMLTTALRPAAIYGEGERRHLPRIVRLMDRGLFFFTIGSATVDWVHVDNLVQAFVCACRGLLAAEDPEETPCGRAYFISDGSPINSWDFLRPLAEAVGCPFPTLELPVGLMLQVGLVCELLHTTLKTAGLHVEPFLTRAEVLKVGVTHFFSIERARRELGYSPTVNSEEGSRRIAKYYRRRLSNADYFRTPSWIFWVLILFGIASLGVVAYDLCPQEGPLWTYLLEPLLRLGLLLFRSREGLQMVFIAAVAVHVLEACIALFVMRDRYTHTWGLWFVQTLLLGYPSLRLILRRNEFMKKSQEVQATVG